MSNVSLPDQSIWPLLNTLPYRDLLSFCQALPHARAQCQRPAYWEQRLRREFGTQVSRNPQRWYRQILECQSFPPEKESGCRNLLRCFDSALEAGEETVVEHLARHLIRNTAATDCLWRLVESLAQKGYINLLEEFLTRVDELPFNSRVERFLGAALLGAASGNQLPLLRRILDDWAPRFGWDYLTFLDSSTSPLTPALLAAARSGSLESLQTLLQVIPSDFGGTLLSILEEVTREAAFHAQIPTVEWLLEQDPRLLNSALEGLAEGVATPESFDYFRSLLRQIQSPDLGAIFSAAVSGGRGDVVRELLGFRPGYREAFIGPLTLTPEVANQALKVAAQTNDLELIRAVIREGAGNLDEPLFLAAEFGQLEAIDALLYFYGVSQELPWLFPEIKSDLTPDLLEEAAYRAVSGGQYQALDKIVEYLGHYPRWLQPRQVDEARLRELFRETLEEGRIETLRTLIELGGFPILERLLKVGRTLENQETLRQALEEEARRLGPDLIGLIPETEVAYGSGHLLRRLEAYRNQSPQAYANALTLVLGVSLLRNLPNLTKEILELGASSLPYLSLVVSLEPRMIEVLTKNSSQQVFDDFLIYLLLSGSPYLARVKREAPSEKLVRFRERMLQSGEQRMIQLFDQVESP